MTAKIIPLAAPRRHQRKTTEEAAIDNGLVRRFKKGDVSAFKTIVLMYQAKLIGLVKRYLHNHADAEEVVQETFIRAYKGLHAFRGDSSLSTWLHCIAINLARNRYQYDRRRMRDSMVSSYVQPKTGVVIDFADTLASEEKGVVQSISLDDFMDAFAYAMENLPDVKREILTLRISLSLTYEDIASNLGITPGTVKSRIARARAELFSLMKHACPDLPLKKEGLAQFMHAS